VYPSGAVNDYLTQDFVNYLRATDPELADRFLGKRRAGVTKEEPAD
jgi:hypothetical protein